MAKKRKLKRKKSKSSRKTSTPRLKGALRVADIFVGIAIFFMLLNAAFAFIYTPRILQGAAELGVEMTAGNLYAFGAAWILLAIFVYGSNKLVKKKLDKHQMWGLLILGILTAVTFRPVSAALIIIAAIIYLVKAKKRR